jgi:hypothetical protein
MNRTVKMAPEEATSLETAFLRDGGPSVVKTLLGERPTSEDEAQDRVASVMRLLEEMAEHKSDTACCLMLSLYPVASELMMHEACDRIGLWIAHNRSAAVRAELRTLAESETDPYLKRYYDGLLNIK